MYATFLVKESKKKIPLGRRRHKCEDNIETNLKELRTRSDMDSR
jgi:hypothetical protein